MLTRLLEVGERSRFNYSVVSLAPGGTLAPRIAEAGIPVVTLGMRRGIPDPFAVGRLLRVVGRQRPDVLQTWLYHADLLGTIASLASRRSSLVWNLRCADLDPADHPQTLPWLQMLLARLSSRPATVIANSTPARRTHEKIGYRPRRWDIIPNGFDTGTFQPLPDARLELRRELGVPPTAPLVGMLGRVHPMKDHEMFFRAAARVVADCGETVFVLAGR